MKVENFANILGADFYTGVPDSQLKALCDYLMNKHGIDPRHHVIAANEGNCSAIAAGYYLATGRIPVVYMQNSGEGNIINPYTSLLNNKVYGIPMIFVIGWRGEPGIHDEPQHVYQGEVTLSLLDNMGIPYYVVRNDTSEAELEQVMKEYRDRLLTGEDVAFVIAKGALSYSDKIEYKNASEMKREDIIRCITEVACDDVIVSTTGKASRELFEIREHKGQDHGHDFLTVGSMGHSSSIAFGIAIHKPERRIWCIDGDGAALMHMGAMAVIGATNPSNMIHVVINNASHETVGGMPTVAGDIDMIAIAKGCGYLYAVCVDNEIDLMEELKAVKERKHLSFVEARCALGARKNLGRPTTTPKENREEFIAELRKGMSK